jgi:hypothetical protein
MDCQTATRVYKTENHLEKIQEIFPEAWAFLEAEAIAFVERQGDRFDTAAKEIVGTVPFVYRVTHRDGRDRLSKDLAELLGDITSRLLLEQHFSKVAGQPIFFSSVCCDGHLTTDHELTLAEVLPIQRAAIQLQ